MQRQHGLSSPVPKLQQDGCSDAFEQMALTEEESSASSSKADKARLLREERSIHLIPLLTFLCFLLLFLCSHDPSAAGKFHPLACIRRFLDQSIYTSCIFLFFRPRYVELWRGVWEPEAEDAIILLHQLLSAVCVCVKNALPCSIRI
jgi:hypothetical protein